MLTLTFPIFESLEYKSSIGIVFWGFLKSPRGFSYTLNIHYGWLFVKLALFLKNYRISHNYALTPRNTKAIFLWFFAHNDTHFSCEFVRKFNFRFLIHWLFHFFKNLFCVFASQRAVFLPIEKSYRIFLWLKIDVYSSDYPYNPYSPRDNKETISNTLLMVSKETQII